MEYNSNFFTNKEKMRRAARSPKTIKKVGELMKIYYLHRRDEMILGTYYADYELYAVKFDDSRAYFSWLLC